MDEFDQDLTLTLDVYLKYLQGPYIKDVRKNPKISDPPVRISRNLSVLFVRKIDQ